MAEELFAPEIVQIVRDTDVLIGMHGACAGTSAGEVLGRNESAKCNVGACRGRIGMGSVLTTRRGCIGTCLVRYVHEHMLWKVNHAGSNNSCELATHVSC